MEHYEGISNRVNIERMKRIKNEIEELIQSMEQDHGCNFVNDNEIHFEKALETVTGGDPSNPSETKLKIDGDFSTNRIRSESKRHKHKTRVSRVCVNDEESVIDNEQMMEQFRKDLEPFRE